MLLFCAHGIFSSVLAQQASTEGDAKTDWWDDVDGFLNQQHREMLSTVEDALAKYPPALAEPLERKMAFLLIDAVMHEEGASARAAVRVFLNDRTQKAVDEITITTVSEGARVWKLYNHGYIVKTKSATIAFDVVRGLNRRNDGFSIDEQYIQQLAALCDVLFISHRHGDHADPYVAQAFLDAGKTVVAANEVWRGEPIYGALTHIPRVPHTKHTVDIGGGRQLEVVNYPGHQGSGPKDAEVDVFLVFSAEGIAMAHTGDQSSNENDFTWIDEVYKYHHVDLFFPNCWSPEIIRMVAGFKPKLIIPGHHNEMGHTIDHREPYWLTYTRLREALSPFLILGWGESYQYSTK